MLFTNFMAAVAFLRYFHNWWMFKRSKLQECKRYADIVIWNLLFNFYPLIKNKSLHYIIEDGMSSNRKLLVYRGYMQFTITILYFDDKEIKYLEIQFFYQTCSGNISKHLLVWNNIKIHSWTYIGIYGGYRILPC